MFHQPLDCIVIKNTPYTILQHKVTTYHVGHLVCWESKELTELLVPIIWALNHYSKHEVNGWHGKQATVLRKMVLSICGTNYDWTIFKICLKIPRIILPILGVVQCIMFALKSAMFKGKWSYKCTYKVG